MKIQTVPPTGIIQHFEVYETFFSTTDDAGIITSGNQVFLRTSGYTLEELLGKPHNIIRHKDIPRCVFHLLWKTGRQGCSFMGYVKNQAKNGNHYWVMAIIVPIAKGYLSVRIKPTTPLLAEVEKVYTRLLQIEEQALEQGMSEGQAAEQAALALAGELKKLGFSDYESFSHYCLNLEIQSRDKQVAEQRLRLFPEELGTSAGQELCVLFNKTRLTYGHLGELMQTLSPFVAMGEGIGKRKDVVQGIAEDFRLNALNAHVAAHPLGEQGIVIGTVAQFLNGHAHELAGNVTTLAGNISLTTRTVAEVASSMAVARIQMEMLLSFLAEISSEQKEEARRGLLGMADSLREAFEKTIGTAVKALEQLKGQIPQVLANKEQLRRDIIYLHVAQISGLTEASRLRGADNFITMFASLRQQIESAKDELEELGRIVEHLIDLTNRTPDHVSRIFQSILITDGPERPARTVFKDPAR